MLVLCADTTGALLSFTLVELADRRVELLYSEDFPSEGRMNEFFFVGLARFLDNVPIGRVSVSSLTINDVDKLLSITGPGSFTGIRIGIAAFAGIASGTGAEHTGLSALDAAALLSGRNSVTVAAKLRMKEYALRSYNFGTAAFSEIMTQEYNSVPDDILLIGRDIKSLSLAAADPRWPSFCGTAEAVYVKKSEAEINFLRKTED